MQFERECRIYAPEAKKVNTRWPATCMMIKMLHENDKMHTAKMNASDYSDCTSRSTATHLHAHPAEGKLAPGKRFNGIPLEVLNPTGTQYEVVPERPQ